MWSLKNCIKTPQNSASFSNFSSSSPSPTLYKVETRRKFWIHVFNIVCGVRGGVGPVWIGNASEMQRCPKTFVRDCRFWLTKFCSVENERYDCEDNFIGQNAVITAKILLLYPCNLENSFCLFGFIYIIKPYNVCLSVLTEINWWVSDPEIIFSFYIYTER